MTAGRLTHPGRYRRYRSGSRPGRLAAALAAALVALVLALLVASGPALAAPRWVSGDIHNHTVLTDGSNLFGEVVRNAYAEYGLDFLANSEHGGASKKDANGLSFVSPVWRWITLSLYAYPQVQDIRNVYPERRTWLGVEWNAPTHEHASVGIVGRENEPWGISDFEYRFDQADLDTSRAGEGTKAVVDPATGEVVVPAQPFDKHNQTHEDMLFAIDWLEETFGTQAYVVVNHPSRKNLWTVGDLRQMQDAGEDVVLGFEGFPGHQASHNRGEYGQYIGSDGRVVSDPSLADPELTARCRTYGGADYMTAKVGGVWDALLGEGRHWWVFNNSDYHTYSKSYKDADGNTIGLEYFDFWPGQYGRTWLRVNEFSEQGIVDAMRAGRGFIVNGDLVDGLRFKVSDGTRAATMGGTLRVKSGTPVTVTIAYRSPRMNANGDRPKVDHVDVITGRVTGRIPAEVDGAPNPAYFSTDTNPTAKVARRFGKQAWTRSGSWYVVSYTLKPTADMYLRLRGTNWPVNTPNQTDAQGNPLIDELDYVDYPNPKTGGVKPDGTPDLLHGNTPETAFADLWFYSNPIFIDVK